MNKVSEAIIFATTVFDGINRKCENHPAILHSLEAASIAQTLTSEQEVVIGAVLHDTVEDAGVTLDEIEEKFGSRVRELVESETENKRTDIDPKLSWQIRKQEAIDLLQATTDVGVKILFLSDKLSNMRSLYRLKNKYGSDLWLMFNQRDTKKQKWYYQSIADAVVELKETEAYKEYINLVNLTFKEE